MIDPVLPTYARAPVTFVRGEGSWLWDDAGRRFLDMGAGIATCSLGHAHPALTGALTAQARTLWHVSNLYGIGPQRELAERLVSETYADTVFLCNSGTEACELAIKMARRHHHALGRPRETILTFEGAFHGRSTGAIAAAGSAKMTEGYGPLMAGFRVLPWGDHDALRGAMDDTVAAVLVEPIQGEGGIRAMPDACLRGLREMCDATGALMILDEVQCGMGRTGRLFAHEWAGVAPDVMMVAKGIGGGFPLGAVLATERAASAMGVGSHGSTYGGNPLACAVGLAVMDHVADEAFLADVRRRAGLLRQRLEGLAGAHRGVFAGVRGTGLMLGLECRVPVGEVVAAGLEALVVTVPAAEGVARLLPALTISDDEIAEGIERLDAAAAGLARRAA